MNSEVILETFTKNKWTDIPKTLHGNSHKRFLFIETGKRIFRNVFRYSGTGNRGIYVLNY